MQGGRRAMDDVMDAPNIGVTMRQADKVFLQRFSANLEQERPS